MAALEVLAAGPQTSVQDLGRDGYRAFGVPRAGAMDRFALAAANRCAGNPPGATALEVLLGGTRLRMLQNCTICVAGADLGATVDGEALGLWATMGVRAGSVLDFAGRRGGARAYLALHGGLDVERVLGSRSTYLPGGWGGFYGRVLRAGDRLAVGSCGEEAPAPPRWLPPELRPLYSSFPTLRCVLGPHLEHFLSDAAAVFLGGTFRVGAASDRMGYRLEGPPLRSDRGANLSSLGVLPGVVQVPPDGGPILLMADAQTTGGYPIIATVIDADLPLAAQLLPGDRLRFQAISPMVAIAAARARSEALLGLETHEEISGAGI